MVRKTERAPGRFGGGWRRDAAERLADVLDPAMSALGIIFLLLVLGEGLATSGGLKTAFTIAGWVIWALFAVEFAARLVVAESRKQFLKRNWWQLLFLAVPFLRFLRLVRTLRLARAGRLFSSAVRTTRSARATLSGRLGWLVAVHVIVVLTSSQLMFELGGYDQYADALHDVALAAVAGEPLAGGTTALARIFEVALATYAVVVFGSIAAAFGAFYIERRQEAAGGGPTSSSAGSVEE